MPPTTRAVNRKGPQWVSVQMNVRMPYWYKEQLSDEAAALRMSPNALILDALERIYKPNPPKE